MGKSLHSHSTECNVLMERLCFESANSESLRVESCFFFEFQICELFWLTTAWAAERVSECSCPDRSLSLTETVEESVASLLRPWRGFYCKKSRDLACRMSHRSRFSLSFAVEK